VVVVSRRCERRIYTCARKLNSRWPPTWGQNVIARRPTISQAAFTNHFIRRVHRVRRRGWQWFTEGRPEYEISAASASVGIDYPWWIIIKNPAASLLVEPPRTGNSVSDNEQ